MKKIYALAAMALGAAALQPAQAADVGVSVQISQPGVYGRVDIGRFPQPTVIVQQPVIVHRAPPPPRPVYVQPVVQPVYMWVPPGHRQRWAKHCYQYGACGVPVVFVQDRWYRDHVMSQRHGGDDRWAYGGPGGPRGGWRGDDRWEDRRDGRWQDRGDDRGEWRGRGHGRGRDD